MKKFAVLFGIILTFGISIQAQDIQILETGAFHGDEVSAQTGETWLGLFDQGGNYSLLPVVLTVETVHDVISDAPDEKTGKEVKILGQSKPLFLIKGKNFVQSRAVKTVFAGEQNIGGDFNETYEFAGRKYNLKVESERADKENPQLLNETSKLVLSDGKTTQILYSVEHCDDCFWRLDWIGDLDGDGKLDFLLNLSDHYNVGNLKLFLSSEAENGNLVKEVAEFTTTGC